MTYSEFEREIIEEMEREQREQNPVLSEFKLSRFVSRSAGRGRKRKRPVEVALVVRRRGGATSWHKFEFDDVATEHISGENSEEKFIQTLLDGQSEPDR